MDGLIKGLLDVAIGNDDREDRSHRNEAPVEQTSRSTWAEVVSGDKKDEEGEGDNRRHQYNHSSGGCDRRPNREEEQWNRGEGKYGRNEEESQFNQPRPSGGRPHQAAHQNYGENEQPWKQQDCNKNQEVENEKTDDAWQTIPKKHPKKTKKVRLETWDSYKQPASEQNYSNHVEETANINPSAEELSNISLACSKLWEIDFNRLTPGEHYTIDCGEGKKVYNKQDLAEGNLFTWLRDDVLRMPTVSRFFALLDNYNPHEGYREVVTNEEIQEQLAFVEEISRTAPIKYVYKYLSAKGIISGDFHAFKKQLIDLWFGACNRGGGHGSSSAFEHVFVGEIKQRGEAQISGFHNWIQFYLEESKGRVDYQGYILPRRRGEHPDAETQVLTLQFEWNGVLKSVSTSFIGVSPEFEVALYTLCFFAGGEDNQVQLGPYHVNIKCYHMGRTIGSAFPIAE